jgi:diguanylate cyclase (GGDEF)-like protein
VLPVWAEALLLLAAVAAGASAWRLRARERSLRRRLEAREREVHFLAESPDPQLILARAYAAAARILPVSRFNVYRIDESGAVAEAWVLPPGEGPDRSPRLDPANAYVGRKVDSARALELAATETARSFAPRQLLAGGRRTRHLRLPLYSGDRLIAHLDLSSTSPIGESVKAELRALLSPLTASLHAARNWSMAVTDELSGLASRRYFETRLAEEWARRDRYGTALGVACFDLDRFKDLNDSLGHGAGDLAIRRFGEIVRSEVRGTDVACRYGGEEFAVLFPEVDAGAARTVAERIRLALERERFLFEGRPFSVTVSAGVADASGLPPGASEKLVFRADRTLYRAKEQGRNRVQVWEPET